jgi:CDP-glycerol glycerophosphotransferase
LIPERIYHWRIYTDPGRASISSASSRGAIQNWRDRLEIYRLIDAFLDQENLGRHRQMMHSRFLRIDLKLYSSELFDRSPEYQAEWMESAAKYVSTMPAEDFLAERPETRVLAYLVSRGDLELVKHAAALRSSNRVTAPIVELDGTYYFTDKYLDDPVGRACLDLSWLRLKKAHYWHLPLTTTVTAIDGDDTTLLLTGRTINQLGAVPTDLTPEVRVRLFPELRSGRERQRLRRTFDAEHVVVGPTEITWNCRIPLATLPVAAQEPVTWSVQIRIRTRDGLNLESALIDPEVAQPDDGRRLVRAGYLADRRMAVYDDRGSAPPRLRSRIRKWPTENAAYRWADDRLNSPGFKLWAYRTVFRRLPIRTNTVVFESHGGRQFSDSPKYLYLKLRELDLSQRAVWTYRNTSLGYPTDATLVRRGSWKYYREMARAGTFIDNQGLPEVIDPRPRQRYVQTWHGSPLKCMGYDEGELRESGPEAQQRFGELVSRWDDFVVMSSWAETVFGRAFGLSCRQHRTGYPRNDLLVGQPDPERVAEIRQRLGVPPGRKVVLYAPTFRRYPRPIVAVEPDASPRLQYDGLREAVGSDWYVLVRAHYLDRPKYSDAMRNIALDVSSYDDITELLLIADVLLTDYSSLMFDFALTRRPMAFFVPDLDLYRTMRGTYFELDEEAPGPLLYDMDGIIEWLNGLPGNAAGYAERYEAFLAKFCEFEDGTAAERIIRQVFADEARKSAAPSSSP